MAIKIKYNPCDINPKSFSSTVALTVMDMNDNAPRFEQTSYNCLLSQHAVRGQFVTIVSASDPDYIDADNLIYSIAEGNELQTYAIDPISGIITLINMQNFAENHSTILNISVSDSVYTSFIRVQINILPANLHNPVFPHLVYDVKINENQMAGRLVITVSFCCFFFFSSLLNVQRAYACVCLYQLRPKWRVQCKFCCTINVFEKHWLLLVDCRIENCFDCDYCFV